MVLKTSIFILILLSLSACGGNEVKSKTNSSNINTLPDGYELYQENCMACHGRDGKLGLTGANDLSSTALNLSEIKETIKNGTSNGMPQFKEMLVQEGEIDAVAEFVLTLKEK